MEEGRKLQRVTRTAKDPVRLRRAIVVLMSGQGQSVRDITSLMQVSEDYVRDVIHAFNGRGFAALDPKWSGGRSRTIGEAIRERICLIARTAFLVKMQRILDLYDHPPDDGRVICVDEFGPLNLMPRKGKAWRSAGSPHRLRATYNRRHGVMHMLAALDLTTGKIHYRIRRRKRHAEFLDLLKTLRARWPDQRLYLVMDNFSPHRHPDVREWAADNDAELVFLPTYSSWLNWIEAEFAALRYFALNGTDHRTHTEQNAAIASFIRWRNARAQPKTGFATDSPIRTWTHYPAMAA